MKAAALPGRTTPPTPATPLVPVQAQGARRSRALPYVLNVDEDRDGGAVRLTFRNEGPAGAAVFHVYDRRRLNGAPRRYTVGAGRSLQGVWEAGAYDLWVLGPNGFHRHFVGDARRDELAVAVAYHPRRGPPLHEPRQSRRCGPQRQRHGERLRLEALADVRGPGRFSAASMAAVGQPGLVRSVGALRRGPK